MEVDKTVNSGTSLEASLFPVYDMTGMKNKLASHAYVTDGMPFPTNTRQETTIIGYAARKAFISDKVQFLNINKTQTRHLPRNQMHLNANQSKSIVTSMHDRNPPRLGT